MDVDDDSDDYTDFDKSDNNNDNDDINIKIYSTNDGHTSREALTREPR